MDLNYFEFLILFLFFVYFFLYLQSKVIEKNKQKIKKGSRIRNDLDPNWYKHPVLTGANRKLGQLWTFNRYGIWKRSNMSFFTDKDITANDGFHFYNYKGNQDQDDSLMLLCSWFNSSIHIIDFLMKCRVPATHVQQVSRTDRLTMLVPKIELINNRFKEEILELTVRLNCRLPSEILDQFDWDERKKLDLLWLKVLNIEGREAENIIEKVYLKLKYLISNR